MAFSFSILSSSAFLSSRLMAFLRLVSIDVRVSLRSLVTWASLRPSEEELATILSMCYCFISFSFNTFSWFSSAAVFSGRSSFSMRVYEQCWIKAFRISCSSPSTLRNKPFHTTYIRSFVPIHPNLVASNPPYSRLLRGPIVPLRLSQGPCKIVRSINHLLHSQHYQN